MWREERACLVKEAIGGNFLCIYPLLNALRTPLMLAEPPFLGSSGVIC